MLDSQATDDELLAVAEQQPAASEELFRRYRRYLRRVIGLHLDRRLSSRIDPSDVVQETLLEASRLLPSYLARRPMPFKLWLRQTAQQRIIDARRRHLNAACRSTRRERPLTAVSSIILVRAIATSQSPSGELSTNERNERVREVVQALDPQDLEILTLRSFENLSNTESATILGISPAASSKRYTRALARLQRQLLGCGINSSSR